MHASPPWGSCSRSSLTPAHEVRFSPLPSTCFAPYLAFCTVGNLLASFTVGDMASRLSVEVGFGSAGLVPLMGKASVSNITVLLGFAVIRKALAMARSSVVASPLAILPLPPAGSVCWHRTAPKAGTLLVILLPGWHPSALHRLAPYCYSPAGTLLLIIVGWHPLCPGAPLAPLPLSLRRLTLPSQSSLRLRLIMVLHCLLGLS